MININNVQTLSSPDRGGYAFTITQSGGNIEQAVKDIVVQTMQGNPGYVANVQEYSGVLNFINIPFGDSTSTLICNWANTIYENNINKLFDDDSVTKDLCMKYTKMFGVEWYRKDQLNYSFGTDVYLHGIIGMDNGITIRDRDGMCVIIFFKGCVTDPFFILNQKSDCPVTRFWWKTYIKMLLAQGKFGTTKLFTELTQLRLKAEKEVFKST